MNMGCGVSWGTLKSGGIAWNEALRYSSPPNCRISSSPYRDIRSSNGLGKKQGVSDSRNSTLVPQRSSINLRKVWYFSGVKFELNCCRRAGIMVCQKTVIRSGVDDERKRISYGVEGPRHSQLDRTGSRHSSKQAWPEFPDTRLLTPAAFGPSTPPPLRMTHSFTLPAGTSHPA